MNKEKKKDKDELKVCDRSDYFISQPDDFIFHKKKTQ